MTKEKKELNLNDAILACNPDCVFENTTPYTDYSKVVFKEGSPIVSQEDAEAKLAEIIPAQDAEIAQEATVKASAKAKLIAGEALTEAEANTVVL